MTYDPSGDSGEITPSVVIGGDTRTRTGASRRNSPYRYTGRLSALGCTASLISNCVVATAAHCLYNPTTKKYRASFPHFGLFEPGYDGDLIPIYPFVTGSHSGFWSIDLSNVRMRIPLGWIKYGDRAFDYAILDFANAGSCPGATVGHFATSTYSFHLWPGHLEGYPGDKSLQNQQMWSSSGSLLFNQYFVKTQMDTFSGNSGGGMYVDIYPGTFVGVLTHNSKWYQVGHPFNAGTRFNNTLRGWTDVWSSFP